MTKHFWFDKNYDPFAGRDVTPVTVEASGYAEFVSALRKHAARKPWVWISADPGFRMIMNREHSDPFLEEPNNPAGDLYSQWKYRGVNDIHFDTEEDVPKVMGPGRKLLRIKLVRK